MMILRLLVVTVAVGCNDGECDLQCGPCPPPIYLVVSEAVTGSAVAGVSWIATVGEQTATGACSVENGKTSCYVDIPNLAVRATTYAITLQAAGYADNTLGLTVAEAETNCCSCGYEQLMVPATLNAL